MKRPILTFLSSACTVLFVFELILWWRSCSGGDDFLICSVAPNTRLLFESRASELLCWTVDTHGMIWRAHSGLSRYGSLSPPFFFVRSGGRFTSGNDRVHFKYSLPWWCVVVFTLSIPACCVSTILRDRQVVRPAFFNIAVRTLIALTGLAALIGNLIPEKPSIPHARWFVAPHEETIYGWPYGAVLFDRAAHPSTVLLAPEMLADAAVVFASALAIFVLSALAAVPSVLLLRPSRRGGGRCRNCAYDLTGNTSGRCPECGMQIRLNVVP